MNNQPSRKNIDDHRSAAVEQHHPRRTRLNLELPLRLAVVHTGITGLCPYFRGRDFFFAVAKATTWSRLKVRHDFTVAFKPAPNTRSKWKHKMISRRDTLKLTVAGYLAATPMTLAMAANSSVRWRYFQADEAGFGRTPVLLTGEQEAILIDGGFTLSLGRDIARAIEATGKQLTTIYVSRNDPDYYFSLRPIVETFPNAKVIAKSVTVEAIKANVQKKLEIWGPYLKENGPRVLADVVIPLVSDESSLDLEGNRIEIVEVPNMHDRRYLWVSSLKAIFGGPLISSGIHVWLADAPTVKRAQPGSRRLTLCKPANRRSSFPAINGTVPNIAAITFTRNYLLAFEEEMGRTTDSASLVAAMVKRYPDLERLGSLELGAKVAKGEIRWG